MLNTGRENRGRQALPQTPSVSVESRLRQGIGLDLTGPTLGESYLGDDRLVPETDRYTYFRSAQLIPKPDPWSTQKHHFSSPPPSQF